MRDSHMLKWLWIVPLIIIADQYSKTAITQHFVLYQTQPIIPDFFNLTLHYNRGMAFGFLNDASGWQRWFLTSVAIIASIMILIWLKQLKPNEKLTAIGLVLILSGAIGNGIDRVMYGHVIDFIQVYYQKWYFPTFNIADSAISIGVGFLLLDMLLQSINAKKSQP